MLPEPELGHPVLDQGPPLHEGELRDAVPLRDSRLHPLLLRLLGHHRPPDVPDGPLPLHDLQLEVPDLEESQRTDLSPGRSSKTSRSTTLT